MSVREQLDQLDELRAAGTAGHWQLDGSDNVFVEYRHKGDLYTDGLVSAAYTTSADAALIVAAVNVLPKHTAALRAVLELADLWDAAAELPGMDEDETDQARNTAALIRDAITKALDCPWPSSTSS